MGQFTQYVGNIDGQVGSLITALDTALVGQGWTKAFAGVNKAAYYSGGATHPVYLRIDDSGPGAGGAKEARMTGYETMTDVDTGTGLFPTAALGLGGVTAAYAIRKSNTADATARAYYIYADPATVYFFCSTGDVAGAYSSFGFGKFDARSSTETWNNICVGKFDENSSPATDQLNQVVRIITDNSLDAAGHGCLQRTYTGVGGAIAYRRCVDHVCYTNIAYYSFGAGILPYPNQPDGGIYMSRVRLFETSTSYRGQLRGLWASLHPVASFNDGDTFAGTGTLAGRTFRVIKLGAPGGLFIVETSNSLSAP